ncbi:TolB-like translocation protein [Pedobacter duraquae]|uniref:WD40 repeat protein n=1 Tax=Pedobacter duraquae TaxID=425511 RepID=A0A4R6IS02_9SPHI|nr:hypothetical protein [Pedobacter duraquae]TDO24736.1 hypothetical protein CLV32_1029 [Pedobacter duraquae]
MKHFNKHKYIFFRYLTLSILILISHVSFGQLFGGEQNPLSVNWRQINTGGFKIIFPAELETEAQRMANTIGHIFPYEGASLGLRKTTLPIVFQNRGVIANGFVQLGPKKSEFNTTPPQQFDSQDWLNNLAVHELRHAAQFDKLTSGRAYPFPEEVYFAWMGASIPLWFFEGDAVSTETSLSQSGRGRQPAWIMPYRTSLLSGEKFSYSKANFGSQKDVTPGYYQLGYLMSSLIRKNAGKAIFDSLLTDIKNRPLRLYPFSKSLRKFSGKTSPQWYRYTSEILNEKWLDQDGLQPHQTYTLLNKKAGYATDYFMPVELPDGRVLTLKQSKAKTARFITIDSNKREHTLLAIGYQEQPWFSYANGVIVWDEIRYDPRFRQRSYSVICRYEIATGKFNTLSRRSRLFSPSLSSDATKIITVSVDLSNRVALTEIDALTGKISFVYPNAENLMLQTPSFNEAGNTITYISVSEKGKSLWTATKSGRKTLLIGNSRQQLSRPVFYSKGIAFNAHYSGIDNIYNIDTASRKISVLSASKFGAFNFNPARNKDQFVFNDYGLRGYEVATSDLIPDTLGQNHFVFFGAEAAAQENAGHIFENIPDSNYLSTPYRKLGHLINIHSVIPVIENDYIGGLQLRSNNLLNTMDSYAGVNYYRDLRRFEYNAGVSLKSFYPIFTANYSNRPKRTFYNTNKGMQQGDWRENYTSLSALIPVNLNALNNNYGLSASVATSYTQRYAAENMPSNFITSLNFPMTYGITLSHSIRQAERDIAPQWGQILRFRYLHQPFDNNLAGSLFSAESFAYFPGLAKNHSFLASFNYQQASGVRRYNVEINTVYGYNNILAKSKLINTLLFNYRFPIAFPDAEVGPLAYIRNIRGGIFLHYENIGNETTLAQPKTFGMEFHSDMNLLRYQPLVDVGTRFVFINQSYHQKPIVEFFVNYTF